MIKEQEGKDIRTTGKSAKSLQVKQKRTRGRFASGWELVGIGYWHFLFSKQGRGPKGFAPPKKILKWVRNKKIKFVDDKGKVLSDQRTAFLVNRKIAFEGTEIYKNPKKGVNLERIISKHEKELVKNTAAEIKQEYEKELNRIIIS
jgi:hypothetical protein